MAISYGQTNEATDHYVQVIDTGASLVYLPAEVLKAIFDLVRTSSTLMALIHDSRLQIPGSRLTLEYGGRESRTSSDWFTSA